MSILLSAPRAPGVRLLAAFQYQVSLTSCNQSQSQLHQTSPTSATASWRNSAKVSRVWKITVAKNRASNLSRCKHHELTAPALKALKGFLLVSENTIVAKSCGAKMFFLPANFSILCRCSASLPAKTTFRSSPKNRIKYTTLQLIRRF